MHLIVSPPPTPPKKPNVTLFSVNRQQEQDFYVESNATYSLELSIATSETGKM